MHVPAAHHATLPPATHARWRSVPSTGQQCRPHPPLPLASSAAHTHRCHVASLASHAPRRVPTRTRVPLVRADTELYASGSERRASLREQKGFECGCVRCVQPPPRDDALDGWRCHGSGCGGVVGGTQLNCPRCHTPHSLTPAARSSIEERWVAAIDEGTAGLNGGRGGARAPSSAAAASAREREACASAMRVVERVLSQSEGKLHEHHALRSKARRLKVYALPPGAPHSALVAALEDCLGGLTTHLPHGHPETAFFQHWLAHALSSEAASHPAGSPDRATLRQQARHAAALAVEGLAISYGADHPFVAKWRLSDADRDQALAV